MWYWVGFWGLNVTENFSRLIGFEAFASVVLKMFLIYTLFMCICFIFLYLFKIGVNRRGIQFPNFRREPLNYALDDRDI